MREIKLNKVQIMGLAPYMERVRVATEQVQEYFLAVVEGAGEDPNRSWRFTEEGSLVSDDDIEGNS